MAFWRQLKWRIVSANMLVVVAGVSIVLLITHLMTRAFVPAGVEAGLAALAEANDPEAVAGATAVLLSAFRGSLITAVTAAALGALIVGLATSLMLARQILRPLRQIAESSRRIARGHYGERVAITTRDELEVVADNFNQMARALERVEEQRVALIGNVSHELRTPLAGLNGYLEGLIDGVFPSNEETYAMMYQEVRRMGRLVDDLQALSRVESGQLSLHLEIFDLMSVVERVMLQIRPQIESQCLELKAETAAAPLPVCADPDRTAQVLLNLLSNAIRYTPEGGCIVVRVTAVSPFAQIKVIDDGRGIPADALPYLFERFYRVDASRARKSGGSGIGLTISRHLAWAMGGDIIAASDGPDQGSAFTFTLPLANAPQEEK